MDEKYYKKQIVSTIVETYNNGAKSFAPLKIDPRYNDSGEFEVFELMNRIFLEYEAEGYIKISYEGRKSDAIRKITIIPEGVRKLAKKHRIRTIDEINSEASAIIKKYFNIENDQVCDFLKMQLSIIEQGKILSIIRNKNISFLDDVLRGVEHLIKQKIDVSMREFSILVYNDSKKFEELLPKIKSIMDPVSDFSSEEFLAIHHVHKNSIFSLIKGNFQIVFNNGEVFNMNRSRGSLQINAEFVNDIKFINASSCYSIENLASFEKYQVSEHDGLVLYLGGFSNNINIDFISKMNCPIFHFGDIDANGFKILHDLSERINRTVVAHLMDTDTVDQYKMFGKPISDYNIKMLSEMMLSDKYSEQEKEVFQKLLDYGVIIEQEIIYSNGPTKTAAILGCCF